jgi:hypothetical protein
MRTCIDFLFPFRMYTAQTRAERDHLALRGIIDMASTELEYYIYSLTFLILDVSLLASTKDMITYL